MVAPYILFIQSLYEYGLDDIDSVQKFYSGNTESKKGYLQQIIQNNSNKLSKSLKVLINDYLNIGYKYDDILILSPSIKTYSIKLLIKNLSKQKISISINKEDYLNKILILPLCESKEIERKIVIIFNFKL